MALRASRESAPTPTSSAIDLRTRDDATQATHEVLGLDDPPTAIFAARNVICTGAVLALQQPRCPHQVALIGFDEVAVGEFVQPRVTVVRQDTHAIGDARHRPAPRRLDGDQSPAAHRGGPDDPGAARVRGDPSSCDHAGSAHPDRTVRR